VTHMNLDYERLKNLTPDTITTAISLLLTTGEHPQLARSLGLSLCVCIRGDRGYWLAAARRSL